MKGIDIFCASQASTAICLTTTMDQQQQQPSSSSTILLGRAIDRYNPIIRDSRRIPNPNQPPPIINITHDQKKKKSNKNKKSSSKENGVKKNESFDNIKVVDYDNDEKKKKQSISESKSSWRCTTKPGDFISPPGSTRYLLGEKIKVGDYDYSYDNDVTDDKKIISDGVNVTVNKSSWRCNNIKAGDFISPPGSTRYLLADNNNKVVFNDDVLLSDKFDTNVKYFSTTEEETLEVKKDVKKDESFEEQLDTTTTATEDQVVVLRVSLHCRGCEKKMRKHISRMEGVTSFNIDFAAKKVTVSGNVTPLGVLSSISKVKNAQLWPPTVASSTPSLNLNNSVLKNNEYKIAGS